MKYDYTIQRLITILSKQDKEFEQLAVREKLSLKYGTKIVEFTVLKNEDSVRSVFESGAAKLPRFALVLCPVFFSGLTFTKEIKCANWIFAGEVKVNDVRFEKPVSFKNALFFEKVSFFKVKFNQTLLFNNCKVFRDALFSETDFGDETFFNNSTFYKNSFFRLNYFAGNVTFQESVFSGVADFSDSHFDKYAFFGGIIFKDDLTINNGVFNGSVNFNGTTFSGDANFSLTHFKNEVLVNWFTFCREVLFNSCTFDMQVNFNDGQFKGKCSFSDVTFSFPLTVSGVTFLLPVDFTGAVFNNNAYFVNLHFSRNIYFSGVTFDGEGQIFFDDSIFLADVFFLGSYFNKEVLFLKSEFCRRTDFTQLNIGTGGKMNIIECLFDSIVDFSDFEEISGKIFIDKSDFIRKCLLNFDAIRGENKRFDSLVIKNESSGKVDYLRTYKNFLSFREIFFRNNELDKELELLYQARVYERKYTYQWNKSKSFVKNAIAKFTGFVNYLFLDKITKYFTSWERVLVSIAIAVFLFSLTYCIVPFIYNMGFESIGTIKGIDTTIVTARDFFMFIGDTLYFSMVTFTTIGYGEMLPTGFLRYVAGFEGFTGITLTSLFLVTLAKRVIG